MRVSLIFLLIPVIVTMVSTNPTANSAKRFTPTDLVSLKRLSSLVASPSGDLAAFTIYQFFHTSNTFTKNIHVLNVATKETIKVPGNETQDSPVWLNDETLIFISKGQAHWTTVSIKENSLSVSDVLRLTDFPIAISNLKAHPETLSLLFTAEVYPDGDLKTADQKDKEVKTHTGVVYDKLFTRHWDTWISPMKRTNLFKIICSFGGSKLTHGPYVNLLKDTALESPVPPHGDESHFNFSPDGSEVSFSSRVPEGSSMAWRTNIDIYIVPSNGAAKPISISQENMGSDTVPLYSPDGNNIAWLEMRTPGYEADLQKIVIFNRKTSRKRIILENWDRSAESLLWSPDSQYLYITAQDKGHVKVYSVKVADESITELVSDFNAASINYLGGRDALLFLRSSPASPSEIFSLDLNGKDKPLVKLSSFNDEALSGMQLNSAEEFWFTGALNEKVMGWIFKPASFSEKETYPLAFLVHGGPEGAWNADWSYRWNPQVYSGAGYVVICINFHGSTGYGIEFTKAILNNWGGHPYHDLMKGLDYALDKYKYIDQNRICALGASYGGFMMNWINGQTDRFSCIVNHDGIFDTRATYYATEELWFPEFEFGGPAYKKDTTYDEWNPSAHVTKWTTPTLIVHGEKDYRLPVTEGLSAFTALQRQHIPSRLLYFPDENHWVLKPANVLQWFEQILNWVDKWTSLDPENDVTEWREHRKILVEKKKLEILSGKMEEL